MINEKIKRNVGLCVSFTICSTLPESMPLFWTQLHNYNVLFFVVQSDAQTDATVNASSSSQTPASRFQQDRAAKKLAVLEAKKTNC